MNDSDFHTVERPHITGYDWHGEADDRLAVCPVCGYSVRLYATVERGDGERRILYNAQCPDGHEPVEPVYERVGANIRCGTLKDIKASVERYNALAAAYDGPTCRPEGDWRRAGAGGPNACPVCGREPVWQGVWFGCPDHPWILSDRSEYHNAVRDWNNACDLLDELQRYGTCSLCHKPVAFALSGYDKSVFASCGCLTGSGPDWRAAVRDWLDKLDDKERDLSRLESYRSCQLPILDGLCAWWDGSKPVDPAVERLRAAGFDDAQVVRILDALEGRQ